MSENYPLRLKEDREHIIRNKFTMLSFLCSVLVIYIHTFNLGIYQIDGNSLGVGKVVYEIESYMNAMIRFAVPMFFIISGLLFFRTFEMKNLFSKWKSRGKSIVVPYIIWCTLYYVYYLILTNMPVIKDRMNQEPVSFSFIEWLRWLTTDEYYTLWFLQNLIVFIALAPVIHGLLKERCKKIPVGFALLVISILALRRVNIGIFEGLEYYLLGSYIGMNLKDKLAYRSKAVTAISACYVVFYLIRGFRTSNVVMISLFCISLWFVLDKFVHEDNLPWWMQLTFFTYVAHDMLLEAFEKILFVVGGSNPVAALLDYLFMPMIVMLVLIGVAYGLKNKLPVVWKTITGR